MHELGIAQQIVAIVTEESRGARVRHVVVEIGRLAAVLPDAVQFCFDLATEGTAAAGASLEIIETPGLARCRACGATFALERPFGRCECGGSELDWLTGDELRIRSMEVA